MSIITLGSTDKPAQPVPPHLLPYAKTQSGNGRIHRLIYHLLDVGQVALLLWRRVLSPAARQQYAGFLALDEEAAGSFLAFVAALHDLGKASPAYQAKYERYAPPSLRRDLAAAGLRLSGYSLTTMQAPHGIVSTWALQRLLPDEMGLERRFARKLARAVGGHHGAWPAPYATDGLSDDAEWAGVRARLFAEVRAVFAPAAAGVPPPAAMSAFLAWFSGFVSVADWLGSIDDYEGEAFFPFEDGAVPAAVYAQRAAAQAEHALWCLGWLGWRAQGHQATFGEMFPEIEQPRPVQEAVIAAGSVMPPALLILEAPTGIGKTEAALYLADTWLQAGGGGGLYVAMPTMATSNQMFGRTRRFLAGRYPDVLVNLHLLHSQAAWDGPLGALRLSSIEDEKDGATGQGRVAAMAWFNQQRKRALLAPFGVGTVDQLLLAVLQTKHFFVRLFGLAHKVIVFDEVHAYDTYMNTLFHRLLAWLGQMGTSVIVLSATLPNATRRALIAAYTGQSDTPTAAPYPALTLAAAGRVEVMELPAPRDEPLALDWSLGRAPEEIAAYLMRELAGGGCAAVICNTVRRAQEVYRALQAAAVVPPKDLILFHARFPSVRREAIERDVLARFGKERLENPPVRAIVVATQVIEQSLDLDFDVMITDLAPVDLLLQRAGRLHRHDRPSRPPLPRRLTICRPDESDGVPLFTKGDVYDAWLMHRTYALLRGRGAINLPSATRMLIEGVYDPAIASDVGAAWQVAIDAAWAEMDGQTRAAEFKAAVALVVAPAEDVLGQGNIALEEDNPGIHQAFQARTRDIDPGVSLVCLHRRGDRVTLDAAAGSPAVDLSRAPNRDTVGQLLRRTITIHNRGVVFRLLDETLPAAWRETSALRHHRLALFENDEYSPPGANFRLRLSDELGLEILFEEAK